MEVHCDQIAGQRIQYPEQKHVSLFKANRVNVSVRKAQHTDSTERMYLSQ